ncbi:MAG: beta-propeller fold lactonase family protein [Albidovulum sp.]|nr:beta-propeller fold lactonase family protein [Albidovulum sp.]
MTVLTANRSYRLAVGSYTESYGDFRARGNGISIVDLSDEGAFRHAGSMFLPNPSYLRHSEIHDRVYATIETPDSRAALASLELPRPGARLRVSARISVEGRLPCHIDLHPLGRWIACACYDTGNVLVKALSDRGDFDPHSGGEILRTGSGPHPVRQTKSHPHGANFSPDGRWLLVPDLGTDELAAYPFDPHTGAFGMPLTWRAPAGSGPRTLAFSNCGHSIALVSELSSEVSSLQWRNGAVEERTRLSSRGSAEASNGTSNTASGLRMHPDGIHFGVANRGDDSISIFRLEPRTGSIQRRLTFPSGGRKPRDFGFSPCGRWLVSANQDSDSCILFEVDFQSVPVVQRVAMVAVRSPSSVCFLSDRQD